MEIRFLARLLRYIFKDAKFGAPLATLFAQVALFAASLCLREMRLCSEYDHSGIKTAILYHVCSVLLCYTNRLSWLGFFRSGCGVKVNSIANLICLILGILLEKFYEKSLASLCFALAMTILFLILVVIIQPRTDLGFFGFLIGVTGSVAYNLFQLKVGTWIVVAICFVLWAFKFWLDKNWLEPEVVELEHDNNFSLPIRQTSINSSLCNPFPAPVIQSIDALIVAGYYLVWASAFLSSNCLNSESCASCSAMEKLKCGAIYVLWLSPAHIHRVYYSLKRSPEIVLKVYLHCRGCERKVARVLKRVEGVKEVATDIEASKVVVKGKAVDPVELCESLSERMNIELVVLRSPLPKPPEPPAVVTVVLKVWMHCEACAQALKKLIRKIRGVESVETNLANDQVTLKGVVEPAKLVDYVGERMGKHASIVKDEVKKQDEEKDDNNKEKAEKKDGEEGKGKDDAIADMI